MYVAQGQPVFRLADLSQLWLIVALHERDLGLVALGQQVSVQVSAYPGKRFVGRVGFIDPVLDKGTRTVRVRVEVANDDSVLKPGMFGIATIYAELGPGLALARPALTGDHACPMHPLERGAAGARCPTCDMEMVPNPHRHGVAAAPLWAVPREAVLSTGKRQLIYIAWWLREADRDAQGRSARRPAPPLTQPDAQGFAVTLGPLAAEYERLSDGTRRKLREYYPLIGGLPTGVRLPDGQLGWHIITRGQFLIDSQMELTAKPSLLRPHGARAGD
jgi:Cu(I)/Ag(I) efflux system membrane fusion protein